MNVMPFGLVNSQATFQRLMDNTLKDLKCTESYIDNCIIFSGSFEEHIADLHDVLERLARANIHVKFRKCQLGYREVEFLGHLISEGGRRPVPTAAEKLAKIPSLNTVSELQRFLGGSCCGIIPARNRYRTTLPIDYFSSSLSQAQKNYSAGQLAAWGLVAACRKWRIYLRGADKVQLMTDHNPLRWMLKEIPGTHLPGGS